MAELATKPEENTEGIPKQALEAAAMAEDLHDKMFGKSAEKPAEEGPPSTPSEEKETPAEAGKQPDTPVEEPPKETAKEPEPGSFEARYNDLMKDHEDLTQQHKTLKGKYDKEVPHNASRADRLSNELAEFKGQVFERLGRMTDGKETPVETKAEDAALVEKAQALENQYGGEYTDMLRAFMLREIQPLLRDSVKPVEESVSSVQSQQELVAEQSFIQAVNENLENQTPWYEDWVKEGSNPDFEAFLDQSDPSGLYTNRQLADIFNENHDGARFALLLSQFYTEKTPEATPAAAASEEPPKKEEPAAPEAPAKTPDEKQQHMLAPDASAPAVTPEKDGEQIIWTQEAMDAFYAKDRKGGYSEDESKRLWDDLLMAPAEGRIQQRQISQ